MGCMASVEQGGALANGGGAEALDERVGMLRDFIIFGGVLTPVLQKAAAAVELVRVGKNTVVVDGEASNDSVYFLVQGRVALTTKNENGFMVELAQLQKNSLAFVEALTDGEHETNVTMSTMEDCVFMTLSHANAAVWKEEATAMYKRLEIMAEERKLARSTLEGIELFKQMSKSKQHMLLELCEPRTFEKHAKVLERGQREPKSFFVIASGKVDVYVDTRKVRTIEAGEYFGEVSIINDDAHSATIVVSHESDLVALELTRADFLRVFTGEQLVLAEISLRVLGAQARLQDVLNVKIGRGYFSDFIRKEFAVENIDFWLAVQELEKIDAKTKKSVVESLGIDPADIKARKAAMLKEHTDAIYEKYIAADAADQINVGAAMLSDLQKKIQAGEYSFDLFSEAKKEVYNMMSRDTYVRFKDSAEFSELLSEIGAYGYSPNRK
ncbi:Regulator of G-protein signaling 1 (RGS1) [Durusdinium trenchii]|uniref:Regulator of G-protein signaling 1 (RGS1) n=1 Tax=Durusdinium trenchii TaxID=1381693 RepID=A0ABP0N5R0_9DINO